MTTTQTADTERETFTHGTTEVRPYPVRDGNAPTSFEVWIPAGHGVVEVTTRGLWSYVDQLQRPQRVEGSRRHATVMRTWDAKAAPFDDHVTDEQLDLGRQLIDAFRSHPNAPQWIAAARTTIVRQGRAGLALVRQRLARERALLDAHEAALLAIETKLELAAVRPDAALFHVDDELHAALAHLERPRRY